jgi:hypothetical protein
MTIRKNILKPARRKLKLLTKLLTCEAYPWFKKPIPLTKRGDYIYIKYLILTKKYCPEKYDGNIILFRTTENPSSCKYLGWETLVNDIRMFEIKGKHLEIFKDNNNREIIKKEIEKHLLQVNGLK